MIQLAVLGSPIEHSLSPIIHGAAYEYLGVAAQYGKFEVRESDFATFISDHEPDKWRGFSLTMPLKEVGFEATESVSPRAVCAGAINTLVSSGTGWNGTNTDISGFSRLLEPLDFERVTILGAGGTARAALVALSETSAKVQVLRRNPLRDKSLLNANPNIEILDWAKVEAAFECDLLINCTPAGALEGLKPTSGEVGAIIDSLYSPWPPPLFQLVKAERLLSGKDLLVSQALEQIALFAGVEFENNEMFRKLRALI